MLDKFNRPMRDLRISVTDRCNFRCTYCMPKEIFGPGYTFLPQSELLSFEELARTARIFSALGVRKIRITGGEPLMRKDLPHFIKMIREIPEIEDIALTTNGSLLTEQTALKLKEAGLSRVSISLDALNDDVFSKINSVNFPVYKVLEAIEHAHRAGFQPIKINMVTKKGINDGEILNMADHFRHTPHVLRFIEYMDVGNSNGWKMEDVISASEILERIHAVWPIEPLKSVQAGEVAKRFRYLDGGGEIGVISSVTKAFCGDCNRARLSSNGQLYTCLFANNGHDLRDMLRSDCSDEEILHHIEEIWHIRSDQYSQLRTENTKISSNHKIEMHHIGG